MPSTYLPAMLTPIEPAVESLDAALGVHYALLAGVKGVALAANLHPELRLGCSGLESMAAGAGDGGVKEPGVYVSLHT